MAPKNSGAESRQEQEESQRGEHAEHERRAAGEGLLKVVVLRRGPADQGAGRQVVPPAGQG
jgi:hypothetical protein